MVTYADLSDLVGRVLTAVSFVQDYVELHLDGPILRSLADPTIVVGGQEYDFPGVGSRDALCSLIGDAVEWTTDGEARLTVSFSGGGVVSIPRSSSVAGPEVAHLVPFVDGRTDVAAMRTWENVPPAGKDPTS